MMSPPSLPTEFCLAADGEFLYLIGRSRNSARAALDFLAECRYKRPTAAITSSSTGQLAPLPLCPLAFQHTEWSERERRPNLPASVSDALLSLPLALSIRPSAPDAVAVPESPDPTNAASDAAAESDLCCVSVRAAGEWMMAGATGFVPLGGGGEDGARRSGGQQIWSMHG